MSTTKTIQGRIINKHGTENEWILSVYTDLTKSILRENPFIPLDGELIIYDPDSVCTHRRIKFGDGVTDVVDLPFIDEGFVIPSTRVNYGDELLSNILETYIFNIDYDTLLAFDTSEIVTGATSASSVLGQAILGQMVLA